MNLYAVIVGLVAIGLGLVVIVTAVALLMLMPRRSARQRQLAQSSAEPGTRQVVVNTAPVETVAVPRSAPVASAPQRLASLPSTPEDEVDASVTTGVLNARDFQDFEALMAAADARTKGKRDPE